MSIIYAVGVDQASAENQLSEALNSGGLTLKRRLRLTDVEASLYFVDPAIARSANCGTCVGETLSAPLYVIIAEAE